MDFVGYRRGENIHGFGVKPGSAPEDVERLDVSQLVDAIGGDNIHFKMQEGVKPVSFLHSVKFEPGRTYQVPERATHLRRQRGQIFFYSVTSEFAPQLNEHQQGSKKRKFQAIPENCGTLTLDYGNLRFGPGMR